MNAPNPEAPPRPADHRSRWSEMLRPRNRRFLLPVTGLWILALDWLFFSSNALSAGLATPLIVLLGFVVGGVGTFLLQRRFGDDSGWHAALKGLLAGLVVGAPWPVGGTLVGGWVLFFSGLGEAKKDVLRR